MSHLHRLCLLLCALGLLLPFSAAGAPPSVLILHSYHPDYTWTAAIAAGMGKELSGAPEAPQVQVEYLDSRRYHDPSYIELLGMLLRHKLAGRAFDLILLSDNTALELVLRHRQELFPEVPVVFCGINEFTPELLGGARRVTGVEEVPSHLRTLELALRLHPATRQVVVIGATENVSGRWLREQLLTATAGLAAKLHFTTWDDWPLEQMVETLPHLTSDTLVLLNSGEIRNRAGEYVLDTEARRQLRAASPVPIYTFWANHLGQGPVGGALVSGERQGRLAAQLGLRILRGEDPDSLPVISSDAANVFLFDYRELTRFGIPLSALPEGSEVLHHPPAFYQVSERELRIALTLLALLCAALLMVTLDRIRAGRLLRRSKAEKTLILDSTNDLIIYYGGDQKILWANRAAGQLLGRDPRQIPGRICHELWQHRAEPCDTCPVVRTYRSGHPEESEATSPDGQIWRVRAFPAHDHRGQLIGVVEICSDITAHKQAEIQLQESEARYRAIVTSFDGLIYICSDDFRIEFMNQALVDRTGRDATGEFCYRALHDLEDRCPWCVNDRVQKGESVRWEVCSPKDNRWYYVINTPIRHANGRISKQAMILDITERKQAEQHLQETRSRLLSVLQTIPDLVWLKDTEGVYLACNHTFERFFGASEADIIGKTDYDFVDKELADFFRQKDREAIVAGNVRINEEWITFAADGHRALLETRKVPVHGADGNIIGVLGIGRDITERKQAEVALRDSEERYRALVDNINVGIYRSTGGDGQYLQLNPAMVKIFGYDSMDELLSIPVVSLYQNPRDRADFIAAIEQAGSVRDQILSLRRKDGTPIWCSCSATSQFDEQGNFKWMEGIVEDVTERYLAQANLERANRELEAFAYTVSHDLRTPLTAIIGFAEVLQDLEGKRLQQESQECLEVIVRQGARMQALMEDLLQLAKVGKVERPEAPANVAAVLAESLERLAAREQTAITTDVPEGLQLYLAPTLLAQLFDNLIGNALRYAAAERQRIEIGASYERQRLRLWVRDHGPGIPAEERSRVFDAFYRGSGSRHLSGTGIGLATVAKIAQFYGGRAWVKESPGGGCTFIVELHAAPHTPVEIAQQ